ncbi:MAG: RNA polymerase-binding protein DksA [Betaproteobacteria bacterium]|nr:RNA polymerase-binding protein DksA [Betaproteobacteria bacterium]
MPSASALKTKAVRGGAGASKHPRSAKNAKPAPSRKTVAGRKPVAVRKPGKPASVKKAARANPGKRNAARSVAVAATPVPRPVESARKAGQIGGSNAAASVAAARNQERYAGLTEADLLRAPPAQYMSPEQIAFFRERLRAMQRELLQKADITSEHLREHDIEPDPTDQATIEEEYALELRARDRERKLLKKIEQALRRIEDGSYGYCEETGDAIGIARLLARPTATLTIEAQSRRELKQKLYGD